MSAVVMTNREPHRQFADFEGTMHNFVLTALCPRLWSTTHWQMPDNVHKLGRRAAIVNWGAKSTLPAHEVGMDVMKKRCILARACGVLGPLYNTRTTRASGPSSPLQLCTPPERGRGSAPTPNGCRRRMGPVVRRSGTRRRAAVRGG